MQHFLHYSGIALWIILGAWLILRLLFGKNWALKVGTRTFFGPGLVRSTKQLIQETKKRDIKEDTVAEVAAHVVWRLTRIGMFAVLLGLVPFILLYQQNRLISKQNELFEYQNERVEQQTKLLQSQDSSFKLQNQLLENQNNKIDTQTSYMGIQNELVDYQNTRIDRQIGLMDFQNNLLDTQNYRLNLQNNLIEAERRGALVILMSNIMDQMNAEINKQKEDPRFNDSFGYSLSDPLIGRIAALSQGFLPYRYLEQDVLTEKAVSPERGQLLLSLVKSNLDSNSYSKLYKAADFSLAYISGADLSEANLKSADLIEADLSETYLSRAKLGEVYLSQANLSKSNFFRADLTEANLSEANLSGADLTGANLSSADLKSADLSSTYLNSTNLIGADLKGADLSRADLGRAIGLTKEQLITVNNLFGVIDLDPSIERELREERPCLFSVDGCQ